jgi:adenylosuccinate lyase
VVLPDSSTALDYILQKAIGLIDGLVVYPERMLENLNATKGLIFSGQLLLALTNKGLLRETAYEYVQRNAMRVWDENRDFHELVKADDDIRSQLSETEVDRVFSLDHYLRNVDAIYRRVFEKE